MGLGCVTFGREIDRMSSLHILDYALEKGINFFDTAAAYGAGTSEKILGEWLAQQTVERKSFTVATKILPPYSAAMMEAAVDKSLTRLRLDCIDLLYLHQWHSSAGEIETLAVLDQLVRKGKIGLLGVSNFTAPQLKTVLNLQSQFGLSPFQFAQNNNNYAVSDLGQNFHQICREHKISIVTYSPLGGGFLTGKYESGLREDTRFARVPGHQEIYFRESAIKRLSHLQKVAAKAGLSPVQLALAWAFHEKGICSVLVGARQEKHIDQAFEALALNPTEALLELERF